MADIPTFESPIVRPRPEQPDAALLLTDRSADTKLLVRASLGTATSHALGVVFGSSRIENGVLICGQRPDEWLVLGAGPAARAVIDGLDLTGHAHVIDQTHGCALFRLSGTAASAVLAKVCSVDLSDAMTPDGAVFSASVAKVTCDITRNDEAGTLSYLVACDRSFGQYLFDAILDAGDEFGIGVAAAPSTRTGLP